MWCTPPVAPLSITDSSSYVSENPQKRMLWRVLTSSALGVILLSRDWLHSLCFWQHHLKRKKKAFLDLNFVFYYWKLFLKPKEYSLEPSRPERQCLKDKKIIWAGKLSKHIMEVKEKTSIETMLLDIWFLREGMSQSKRNLTYFSNNFLIIFKFSVHTLG